MKLKNGLKIQATKPKLSYIKLIILNVKGVKNGKYELLYSTKLFE